MNHNKKKTYLITSAVNGAPLHKGFMTCLKAHAKKLKAEIIVSPLVGAHRDDILSNEIAHDSGISVIPGDKSFSRKIALRQFFIRPQQINPLTGLQRFLTSFADYMSVIIPSPKQFFQSVATLTSDPRVIYTTGACTKAAYRANAIGRKADYDHVLGAVILEVGDRGIFHARHIRWADNGFTDLGINVRQVGKKGSVQFKNVRAQAVIPGDWHTGDTDPVARKATFDMFQAYEPKQVVLHDIFNGHSINHHEEGKAVMGARRDRDGRDSLPQELKECADELKAISDSTRKDCKVLIAKSNHDAWLDQYLEKSGHVKADKSENWRLCTELSIAMYDGKDPLEVAVRKEQKLPKVHFLKRKQAVNYKGWEIGQHGDAGVNGSRGTTAQIERIQGHAVIGHQHSPAVLRGTIVVGTNTLLQLDYSAGSPSTWLHANAVIWPDGSAQLLVMPNQRACKWSFDC